MQTYAQYFFANKRGGLVRSNDIRFGRWINRVERIVIRKTGLNLLNLPDEDYMTQFEQGTSSKSMARIVINDFKGFNDFFY